MPFLECETPFPGRFLAYCDSNVVLAFLSLFFIAFCFQFVLRCTQRKSDKDFIGGHHVVAVLFIFLFFFFSISTLGKNTMQASTFNMEIKTS